MHITTAVAVIGAVTGVTTLVWRLVDEFGSFLRIAVEISPPAGSWITVLTTVENKGFRPKKIDYAVLLIGPELGRSNIYFKSYFRIK